MSRRKGTRPEQYAGPFQQYSEIPQQYRLETYASNYAGDETWQRYRDEVLFEAHPDSQDIRRTARRAGRSWLEHMQEGGRHHALATPDDANAWCLRLLNADRTVRTCYEQYFVRIYRFYEHLKSSYRHPHLYNPLLLAAIEYDATRRIWNYRIERRPEVVGRE